MEMHEYEFSDHIMGTDVSVAVIVEDENQAVEICSESLTRLREYEKQFSRFLPESELSLLNTNRSYIVSPFFIDVLHKAKELYDITDGHFNPLLQIERFGYIRSFDDLDGDAGSTNQLPYNRNIHMIEIDEQTHRVTLVDDQKLDFGGLLKGYLAENEAYRIKNTYKEVSGVIVNIGGDLYTRGRDEHGNVFVFEIENPITGRGIDIPLENTGLATSGTHKRTWDSGGKRMHHILAREGDKNPQSNIISSSVIHIDGSNAEAFAKTLITIPPETLESMVGQELQYILIHADGTIQNSL